MSSRAEPRWLGIAVALVCFGGSAAEAQAPGPQAPAPALVERTANDSSIVVTPGPKYGKSGLWTVIAGTHYRHLWTTPIRVPVLDVRRFAGGLRPIEEHSGSQTQSLLLAGANGREYQFRSVNKDPAANLPADLRGTAYARALQDGVSASFPIAPLVANRLLEATGVLVPNDMLVLMPDDPALGRFRSHFKGALGLLEERPQGTAEAKGLYRTVAQESGSDAPSRVISATGLFRRIDASPNDRVDARAFLRARLMDIWMGDRDRHRDQFQWAAFGEKGSPTLWQPISRDHDEAFVNLDGLALDAARLYYQPLITFKPTYPAHDRLNWHAREVDRRFLVELGRGTWDSMATALRSTLTDSVIGAAVHQMPPEMYAKGGQRLAQILRSRRDGLVREALSYYEFLAHEVEIHATNAAEVAEISRVDQHHVDVAVRALDANQPYFSRRFDDRETREVRLMLWGANDQVTVRGAAKPQIRIRVVGGAGNDSFIDSTRSGSVHFYDDQGHTTSEGDRRLAVNTRHHDEWIGSDTNRYPPRDWGTWNRPLPWVEVNSDVGVFVGAGLLHTEYGFRRAPFASQFRVRAGYSTRAKAGRADVDAEFHPENTSLFWQVHARASGVEVLRYYGQGNDTPNNGNTDFNRVNQHLYALEPAFVVPFGRKVQVSIGPLLRFSRTRDNAGRFIAPLQDTLLGGQDFGRVGGRLQVDFDTRDRLIYARHGVHLWAAGEVEPGVWDVPHTYGSGEVNAEAFASAALPLQPTLALRVGGRRVWGEFPFFDSAFLGGASTLPGYNSNRFAGDASVHGGAELRLSAGHSPLAIPAMWGLYGNIGAGRVYVDSDSPGGWHSGGGGGIWLAMLNKVDVVSLGVATSPEGTLLQGGMVFGF
jgi:hypothetical protein